MNSNPWVIVQFDLLEDRRNNYFWVRLSQLELDMTGPIVLTFVARQSRHYSADSQRVGAYKVAQNSNASIR